MAATAQTDLFVAPPNPEKAPPPRRLMLVDVSGFIFRAYHALPPMTTSRGQATGAVLGFCRMMLKLLRDQHPTHLALCFDKDSRQGRLKIDPEYKATRSAPPEDLVPQFGLVREAAKALALEMVEAPGWEADDVIATLVKRYKGQIPLTVVSSDKDLTQLLDSGVEIFDPHKDTWITPEAVEARFGVQPGQMGDYLSLVGDSSDNIKKVPGIGPKTAVDLLKQFGSIDGLLASVDRVEKPKIRQTLKDHAELLKQSRDLVRLRDELELPQSLESFARRPLDLPACRKLFAELEFTRLMSELPQGDAPPTPAAAPVVAVVDAAGLEALAAQVKRAPTVALVVMFDGTPSRGTLAWLGVSLPGGGTFAIDVTGLGLEVVASSLGGALATPAICSHDGKAAWHACRRLGVARPNVASDTQLWSYVLHAERRSFALEDIARDELNRELAPRPANALELAPWAHAVLELGPELERQAEAAGVAHVVREMEVPLIPIVGEMEELGVCLDVEALKATTAEVTRSAEALLADVYRLAGHTFNVGSPAQLGRVLYEELKLPVLKKNKTGPSTDHEVLEKLAEQHPLPSAIIEYRNVAKLLNTYLETLPEQVGPDGRIHTTFHLAAAATGRLSSTDPNLQNIPIRTELGRKIRSAFVAAPRHLLISADYSQIELRLLAHVSEDPGLLDAFASGADVHQRTAAEVFGVALEHVSDDQRRAAKMVNYGIAYGLSAHGLSQRLNIPVDEAKQIIDRYFEKYRGIANYLESTVATARSTGFVETLFGRRRAVPDIKSPNRNVAQAAERAAINMPIQGTAADLMKKAMITAAAALSAQKLKTRMLLQVHDELLLEAPKDEVEDASALVRSAMAGVANLKVPLVVDCGSGANWDAAH